MRIHISSLDYSVTAADLNDLLKDYGGENTYLATKDGASRGFAFADVDGDKADAAVADLDGSIYHGRRIRVGIARARRNPWEK